ncbi:ectonucleotide pyrophosphatase/phosphodiesterase [Sphingomonas canadensis]|uniref:Ectonucleotide pyrophosphatase/phosphodiesterase n=1 Tax=Sphingomonas canadensis TaxID=1219257 RepID=A0ABW3H4C7_9SPHN|nr:ectonucleotide pyrophosphatase/phosphodiesterase [Sphingomonas canadensis]MCW3836050.1 ectonucleotide pyrophosphatase/phosphodiesterase [Sphingomonas canadensis]
MAAAMFRFVKLAAALALALGGQAASARPSAPTPAAFVAEKRATVTILVSLDGFRPDYVTAKDTPNLFAATKQGVFAAMRPSFPTMTFPNHYTLVTGLRPDRHGIIDNNIRDPERPGVLFQTRDASVTRDPFWWDGGEPIWVAAQNAGIRTGEMYWPGSHSAIRGVRPDIWWPYEEAIGSRQRTDTVLDWLRRPAAIRPRLITLYYSAFDRAAHDSGFYSPELKQAIAELDGEIGYLRAQLAAMRQPANLVIVSDHGMAPVPPEQQMPVSSVVDPKLMDVIVAGPMLYIFPKAGSEEAAAAHVLQPRAHSQCWRKEEMPARFHYGTNRRIPALVCLAETGWRFNAWKIDPFVKGDHGFDNDDPQMRAMFIAVGPAFAKGRELPMFDNVDVYPLLRRLIGLPPAADVDGTGAVFAPVLTGK